jgi:membrane protease YdiL (CAAX protease family)
MNEKFEDISLSKAVLLHLFPGAIITLIFIVLATSFKELALPALFWLVVAIPIGLIPSELGYLFYVGYQRNGRLSLDGILGYQKPLTFVQYLWMVPAAFLAMLVLFTIAGFADQLIYSSLFGWLPAWLNLEIISFVDLEQSLLILLVALTMIFVNILGPIVEELYFRGYLLPRLSRFGRWAPLLNTFLFALYHFWTPWHLIQRTIGALPMAIAAKRGNLRVAIITHVLVNTIGFTLTLLGAFAS